MLATHHCTLSPPWAFGAEGANQQAVLPGGHGPAPDANARPALIGAAHNSSKFLVRFRTDAGCAGQAVCWNFVIGPHSTPARTAPCSIRHGPLSAEAQHAAGHAPPTASNLKVHRGHRHRTPKSTLAHNQPLLSLAVLPPRTWRCPCRRTARDGRRDGLEQDAVERSAA